MSYVFAGVDVVTAALFAWIVGTFGYCWATESGSFWERTLKAGKDSATIVWAKIVMAISMGLSLVIELADALGDPQVGAWMQAHLSPQVVGYVGLGVMLVTVLARKRSM